MTKHGRVHGTRSCAKPSIVRKRRWRHSFSGGVWHAVWKAGCGGEGINGLTAVCHCLAQAVLANRLYAALLVPSSGTRSATSPGVVRTPYSLSAAVPVWPCAARSCRGFGPLLEIAVPPGGNGPPSCGRLRPAIVSWNAIATAAPFSWLCQLSLSTSQSSNDCQRLFNHALRHAVVSLSEDAESRPTELYLRGK